VEEKGKTVEGLEKKTIRGGGFGVDLLGGPPMKNSDCGGY